VLGVITNVDAGMQMDTPAGLAVQLTSVDTPLLRNFEDLYRREYPGLVAVATAMSGSLGAGDEVISFRTRW
jgi:hypothetical protein